MSRVVLPKDVATTIKELRSQGLSNSRIILVAYGRDSEVAVPCLNVFVTSSPVNSDTLLIALINGFEVESTPVDKFKSDLQAHIENVEFYADKWKLMDSSEKEQERYSNGFVTGAKAALNAYGLE